MSPSRGLNGQVVRTDGCKIVQRLVIIPSFIDIEQVHFLSRPLVAIEKTLRVCLWNVPPTVTVGSHGRWGVVVYRSC